MGYMIKYGNNPEIIIPYIDMEVVASVAGCRCNVNGNGSLHSKGEKGSSFSYILIEFFMQQGDPYRIYTFACVITREPESV